ncbi:uncharacterized protein LOC109406569 [Aedes albopictus]|uniref:AAA+ ATPase domain-containing protein n=1 Tax=Aedes albopictus TaxID=7160 RepID=A0ABM1XU73_AEDAL|nr:uncharacterized protein LOC109406569 [Aedes albopictus]
MYFKCCEMDEMFDRFVLLLAKRFVNLSKYFYIHSGTAISKDFKNYVLVLHQNETLESQLTIVEYRISIEDYRKVTSRDDAFETLKQWVPVGSQQPLRSKHVLILANYRPESVTEDSVEVLDQEQLQQEDLTGYPRVVLNMLRAARLDPKFSDRNIYEVALTQDSSEKFLKELLLSTYSKRPIANNVYYRLDPITKNAISLLELLESPRDTDLGLFLIRQASRSYPLITHVQPVRQLSDVTDTTRFIVSDTVSFEELCARCPTVRCHEVIFREDYGLVYWQRSNGPTNALRPFLGNAPDEYERCIPPSHWLSVIYSEGSSGKSEFLKFLEREFRRVKPFGWVRMVDGRKLGEISQLSVEDGLRKLCEVNTEQEFEALKNSTKHKEELLLLIDDVDQMGDLLVPFLKGLEELEGTVKVWVAASSKIRILIESSFPIVCHEFPVLVESDQAAFLRMKLPNATDDQVEILLDLTRKQNLHEPDGHPISHPYTGNAFNLQLVIDVGSEGDQSKYEPELLGAFVDKHCPADRLEELQKRCYETVVNDHFDTEINHLCLHSTVVEYMASRYLANNPQLVSLDLLRSHKPLSNLLDRVLTKDCQLARSVLNKDLDGVRANLDKYEASVEVLQRTPLHLCHDALPIAEVLVTAAGSNLEHRCLLSSFTPLQMADERQDWQLVELLLKHGASASFQNLRLQMMPQKDLIKVLDDCIGNDLLSLIQWILSNRSDLCITQSIIYSISVHDEFDQELAFRILQLAYDQDLPSREIPFRYMWGNTALHQAAYSNNLEMCRFLVEKLRFDVDAEDYSGETALQEATEVAVVEYLRSKSAKKIDKTIPEAESEETSEDTQESVFYRACYSDNLELVRYAVEREGHDPLMQEHGTYGLIRAAAWGSLPIVQYLYDAGFCNHLDLVDDTDYTALATAVRFEHFEVVKFLVEKGTDTSKIRDTPSNRELLNFMINSFGFKPDVDFEALTQLSLDELRETQFDCFAKDKYGKIFLHYYVAYHENTDVLRFILTKYDNIDLECEDTGRTALHEALVSHHPELADVLLQAGADYRKRCSKTGQSVLHFAAIAHDRRHLDEFLAKPDMTIDDRDNEGETIIFSLGAGSAELIRYLVDRYDLNVNAQNNHGHTKVHQAIIQQNFFYLQDLERLLRDAGANQNVTDNRGRLALHYAVEKGDITAVRVMERYGYQGVHVQDQDGKSPWILAEEHNQNEI